MAQRILVIEDEAAVLFAYQRLFASQGYLLDTCQTSHDAELLLQKQRYDAVISDLRLGGQGNSEGLTILQQVHTTSPETVTFLVTGYGSPETRQAVTSIGGMYLEKPVDPISIVAMLKSIMKSHKPDCLGGERLP
jgi:two-component system response regulator PilR (NtrC family)